MKITRTSIARSVLPIAFVFGLLITAAHPASAQARPTISEKVLYSFSGGADGAHPLSGLIRDGQGNLYGTTEGGTTGYGTVYALNSAGTEKVLYSFTGGVDGSRPLGSLVRDAQGNLYGTTFYGGAYGFGTVFKVASRIGQETVLYSFTGGLDGSQPRAGLLRDAQGNLFGTTGAGGKFTFGTVFELTPSGTETVLHSFNYADGLLPSANLIADAQGNMYGTTTGGGQHGSGTVFMITPGGTETALYSFGSVLPDGFQPKAPLIRDAQGNLYGVTEGGGKFGYGVVFQVTAAGVESLLYTFTGGADGRYPDGGLVRDGAGNLYGTTSDGGNFGCGPSCGVVFEVSPSGTEKVLYSFTEANGDGAAPFAGLTPDGKGGAYGTTSQGGAHLFGAVFQVGP